jgi:TetR/AcrR family transcriptional repressor of bet genes
MPKKGMEPIRRRQLIAATMETIHDLGFCDVTIAEIARRAGVSYGLAHHYFGSKDQLMTATMRHLLTSLGEEHIRQLTGADSAQLRIRAVCRASFSPAQFQPVVISAWLAFYMQAQTGPSSRHLLKIYARRLVSNLGFALAQMLPRDEARELAEDAAAVIDGLWIRWALSDNRPPAEDAAAYAERGIARLIGARING